MGNLYSAEADKHSKKETLREFRKVHGEIGDQLSTLERKGTIDEDDKRKLKTLWYETSQRFVRNKQNDEEDMQLSINFYEQKCKTVSELNTKMAREIDDLKNQLRRVKEEAVDLRTRLSKLAGEQLTKDNPNIADLSDKNRPTKLGEMYSELYDNEWTDAFVELSQTGHDDKETSTTLRETLMDTHSFCHKKSQLFMDKMHEAANLLLVDNSDKKCVMRRSGGPLKTPPLEFKQLALVHKWKPKLKKDAGTDSGTGTTHTDTRNDIIPSDTSVTEVIGEEENVVKEKPEHKLNVSKLDRIKALPKPCEIKRNTFQPIRLDGQIRKLRKDLSAQMVPLVQKAYIKATWDNSCVPTMKPYIKKCIYICWMMVVQSPPMCLYVGDQGDIPTRFDGNVYKAYTQSGKNIDYVVWPPLMLHETGPLVCKGVAQGLKET